MLQLSVQVINQIYPDVTSCVIWTAQYRWGTGELNFITVLYVYYTLVYMEIMLLILLQKLYFYCRCLLLINTFFVLTFVFVCVPVFGQLWIFIHLFVAVYVYVYMNMYFFNIVKFCYWCLKSVFMPDITELIN